MKLPEAERLRWMNRYDNHIQLWAVPRTAKKGSDKAGLTAARTMHQFYRETFYLGPDRDPLVWLD